MPIIRIMVRGKDRLAFSNPLWIISMLAEDMRRLRSLAEQIVRLRSDTDAFADDDCCVVCAREDTRDDCFDTYLLDSSGSCTRLFSSCLGKLRLLTAVDAINIALALAMPHEVDMLLHTSEPHSPPRGAFL